MARLPEFHENEMNAAVEAADLVYEIESLAFKIDTKTERDKELVGNIAKLVSQVSTILQNLSDFAAGPAGDDDLKA